MKDEGGGMKKEEGGRQPGRMRDERSERKAAFLQEECMHWCCLPSLKQAFSKLNCRSVLQDTENGRIFD